MRRLLFGLLVLGLLAPDLRADEKPPSANAMVTELNAKLRGKPAEERNKLLAEYGPKFVDYAEKDLKAKDAFLALSLALQTAPGNASKGSAAARAVSLLEKHFAQDPQIVQAARYLGSLDVDATAGLVKAVIEGQPDKKVAAQFGYGLMERRQLLARMGADARADAKVRADLERQSGKEGVERLVANAEKNKKDAEEMARILDEFAARIVADAEKDPKASGAFEGLVLTLQIGQGEAPRGSTAARALSLLEKHFAGSAQIANAASTVAQNDVDATAALVKAVIENQPDKKVASQFVKGVMEQRKRLAELGATARGDGNARAGLERQLGKNAVDRLVANADKNKKDAEALARTLEDRFAAVAPMVGKPAPEVVSKDLDGKETRLSSLKGKVVVLDIWATWCGPCRAMIPHEREMVKKLKDRPFALVSISADEDVNTVKEFIKKEPMPWTHWWNGATGGILDDWKVEYYPTIYVLDHKGVVRFKDVRDKQMEEAVEKLLKEMEDGK